MHPQPLPTIAAPSPGNEDDGSVVVAVEKREDFSEKINLDLGIGICGCANEKIKQEEREPFLTKPQFYEFHNPTLVCNPITFGLPLFIGFCPKSSGHTSSTMDTEPGRCRRTDGRKWRCTKSVIPHQKYCERHMHRGRRASTTHTSTPIEGVPISGTKTSEDNRNLVAMSNPSNLDPSHPYSSRSSNGGSAILRDKSDENSDGLSAIPRKIINREHNVAKNNYIGSVSPRFGSSPKSVLHNDAGSKCITETSLQRCQRTDGKKWQCRKDVVPNQKYCELHMHRGAKRIVSNLKSSGKVLETSRRRARISCTAGLDSSINLNIVAANPQQHFTENKSTSSSTSDATTITD